MVPEPRAQSPEPSDDLQFEIPKRIKQRLEGRNPNGTPAVTAGRRRLRYDDYLQNEDCSWIEDVFENLREQGSLMKQVQGWFAWWIEQQQVQGNEIISD